MEVIILTPEFFLDDHRDHPGRYCLADLLKIFLTI